jgi:uncharacterized protein (UPF0128 family)
MEISWVRLRRTPHDYAAADLVISVDSIDIKYNIYLQSAIELQFKSLERSRVELVASLLRHVGVSTEMKKEVDRNISKPLPTGWRLDARISEKSSPRSSGRLSRKAGWTLARLRAG